MRGLSLTVEFIVQDRWKGSNICCGARKQAPSPFSSLLHCEKIFSSLSFPAMMLCIASFLTAEKVRGLTLHYGCCSHFLLLYYQALASTAFIQRVLSFSHGTTLICTIFPLFTKGHHKWSRLTLTSLCSSRRLWIFNPPASVSRVSGITGLPHQTTQSLNTLNLLSEFLLFISFQ